MQTAKSDALRAQHEKDWETLVGWHQNSHPWPRPEPWTDGKKQHGVHGVERGKGGDGDLHAVHQKSLARGHSKSGEI